MEYNPDCRQLEIDEVASLGLHFLLFPSAIFLYYFIYKKKKKKKKKHQTAQLF